MSTEFLGSIQHWRGPCPHCGTVVQFDKTEAWIGPWAWQLQNQPGLPIQPAFAVKTRRGVEDSQVYVSSGACPSCNQTVISMTRIDGTRQEPTRRWWFAWPEGVARAPVSTAVPAQIATDYREAVAVLPASASASAALARRCLQALLRVQGHNQHKLVDQITSVIPSLPRYLQHDIDVIRVIGNNAAHPSSSEVAHAVEDVLPGEAEWSIEIIEELLDFFYARPEESSRRRAALNARLVEQGKKPLPDPRS